MTDSLASRPGPLVIAFALGLAACDSTPIDAIQLEPGSLRTGMVAHWTFDDQAGGAVLDSSGNNRTGTLMGGTWLTDGRFGGALHLENGEAMTLVGFPNATANWSVSIWVRLPLSPLVILPPTAPWQTVLSTEAPGVNLGGWEVNIDRSAATPGVHFGFFRGPTGDLYETLTCPCMQLGRWTHAAAVVDGDALTLSLYVDGQLRLSKPLAHPILPNNAPLNIGRWANEGRLFTGDIDDAVIYSRVLAPEEIVALHQGAAPVVP